MRVFYDLTCPFCYLAQPFNNALRRSGASLTGLPFQAHPEIPSSGTFIGPRRSPMYDNIASRARTLKLPLKWRDVLPNSSLALAAAEWTRIQRPEKADEVQEKLFHAHFAGERDIGDSKVVVDVLGQCGVDMTAVERALNDGSALRLVDEAERIGRELGVMSTPTWESDGHVVSGLQEGEVRRLLELEQKKEKEQGGRHEA